MSSLRGAPRPAIEGNLVRIRFDPSVHSDGPRSITSEFRACAWGQHGSGSLAPLCVTPSWSGVAETSERLAEAKETFCKPSRNRSSLVRRAAFSTIRGEDSSQDGHSLPSGEGAYLHFVSTLADPAASGASATDALPVGWSAQYRLPP